MTVFESILIVILGIIACAFAVIAVRGEFTIKRETRVIEEKKPDPIQLEIAKANLEELQKYNKNAERASEEQTETVKNITSAIQDLIGVNDDERR